MRRLGPLVLACWMAGVSCNSSPQEVSTRTAALTGDPIESITQTKGDAPVEIFENATPQGSIQSGSFTIGLSNEDAAQCQANHPPTHDPSLPGTEQFADRDDGAIGFNWCLILADLAQNHYYTDGLQRDFPVVSYDDTSIVEVVVNVGTMTTLHWEWTYEAWHELPISSFNLDLVAQDGTTTHLIQPITAPPNWSSYYYHGLYGRYSTGKNSNDIELSRFWPNQKVRLEFQLHNSFIPTWVNVWFPNCPRYGQDCSGETDYAMAKVLVNNLHISSDTCPVDPLPTLDPIAQAVEDGGPADTADLDPAMQAALSCLENALGTDDSIIVPGTGAYRPPSYQQHLYDVHQRWLELHDNTDPECAQLKADIEKEEKKHALYKSGAAPGDTGKHTKGLALDLENAAALVGPACTCGLYRRYVPAWTNPNTGHVVFDRPHFELNPTKQPCN